MTLNEAIAFWTKAAFASETRDAAILAFGVATGLKLAKEDHGASDDTVLEPDRPDAEIRKRDIARRGLEPGDQN